MKMSSLGLVVLLFLGVGGVFACLGLVGLLDKEIVIWERGGNKTRYTGFKAVAISSGMLMFGLSFIFVSIVGLVKPTPETTALIGLGFIVAVVSFALGWIISAFVSGTVANERTKS